MQHFRIFVCSSIKGLLNEVTKKQVKELGRRFTIQEITPEEISTIQEEKLPSINILIADNSNIGPLLYENPSRFGFIQGTWAGIDPILPYIKSEQQVSTQVCRFNHPIFSQLIAEYVVAQVINWERKFFEVRKSQEKSTWMEEEKRLALPKALNELTIGLLGLGNMGSEVAKVFKTFGSSVWALKRDPSMMPQMKDVDKIVALDELSELLSSCDYICNTLPKTEKTTNLLHKENLQLSQSRKPVFINVGRANVISDQCLLEALESKWLSGAILDVFHQEPLPPDHAFWTHPQIVVTPHVSAISRPAELAECFWKNLSLFAENQQLTGLIDWKEAY